MDNLRPLIILLFLGIFLFSVWTIGGYVAIFCALLWAIQMGEGKNLKEAFLSDLPLCLVFAAFWLSSLLSNNLPVTITGGLLFTLQVGLYLLVRLYLKKQYCFQAINLLLFTGLIVSLVGIYQYFFLTESVPNAWMDMNVYSDIHTRVFSTLYNPNVLGTYLVLIITLTLGSIGISQGTRSLALFTVLVAAYFCLFFTFSRGAWLAMLISVVALFLFYRQKKTILLVLVLIALVSLPEYSHIMSRMNIYLFNQDSSSTYRILIWKGAWKIIEHNWLVGVGLGNFSSALAHYLPVKSFQVFHAHNTYLHILAETGIIGFLASAIFFGSTVAAAYHTYAASANQEVANLGLGILVAMLGLMVHGVVDATLFAPQLTVFFWILAGLVRNLGQSW